MGLWGSKPTRELTVKNAEKPAEIYVTENALSNVIKTSTNQEQTNQENNNSSKQNANVIQQLPPNLHDKRIDIYEKSMLEKFNETTKEVEKLFGERYESLPVCLDLQANIANCYTENPKHPLKCINIANQYLKCVELERQKRLDLNPRLESS